MEGVDALILRLLSYQVEGVLIASSVQNSQIALQCVQAKRRVVLINRYVDLPEVSAVCCDNYLGGKLAAAHLLEMKYKRFAFLAGSESTFGSKKREEGFTTRLEVSGKRLAAREIGNYNYSDASEAARRLLKLSPRPDAIFCANDIMALAVLDVARREFGLSVPHELGVVGFDNTAMSAAASAYDLTSIDQDIRAMTGTAVRILLAEPQTQDSKLILTSCRLQVRSSSRRV
jgi:DNA-binding LacI/PurR family transcriptional regulator